MLLPGLGLIVATLVGRFHYATDLMCALPMLRVVLGLAVACTRAVAARRERRGASRVDERHRRP